jgi:hypothetical protein
MQKQNQVGLGHELIHAQDSFYGTKSTGDSPFMTPDKTDKNGTQIVTKAEFLTRGRENVLRAEQGFTAGKLRKRLVE